MSKEIVTITVPQAKVAELVRAYVRAEHPSFAEWSDVVKLDRRGAIVEFSREVADANQPNS